MDADEHLDFDASVACYLDGALGDEAFERLQSALRESSGLRRRFYDLCRQAQECSEVSDVRGVLVSSTEFTGSGAQEAPRQRLRWARGAAAAAVLAAGLIVFNSGEPAKTMGDGTVDPSPASSSPPESRSVWLLESNPLGLALTPVISGAETAWGEIETEVPPAAEPAPTHGWDEIGLLVVHQGDLPSRPDDIRL